MRARNGSMQPLIHWLFRRQKRWSHLQSIPVRQFAILLLGVFLLFTVMGFYADLISGGRIPYIDVLVIAFVSGLNAAIWVIAVNTPWPISTRPVDTVMRSGVSNRTH